MRTIPGKLFVAAAFAALFIGCEGSQSAGRPQEQEVARESAPPGTDAGGLIAGPQLRTRGRGGADRYQSGRFYIDNIDVDVRARTENQFGDAADVDEYVVVERADGTEVQYGPDRVAALRAVVDGAPAGRALPLERTDVRGDVALNVASVGVTQVYTNPFAEKIEAVYVFPLPQDAAVSDFVMVIGERRIRGIVREREEARRIYEAARAQGHQASLLSQERPNVFTQRVANIEPGGRIDVEITYFQTLPWRDGAFEMVVPTVVGPRFNPPGSTEGVGAIAAEAPAGSSGQQTEVPYLPPDEAGSHRLTLEVALDLGMPLDAVQCDSHPVDIVRDGTDKARIALRDGEDVPNRDFVLRFAPQNDELGGAVAVHRDADSGEGWFTMLLQPPLETVEVPPQRREMIFVVDCSGSMRGEPLAACKRAIRRCLQGLDADDSFQIIRFSEEASTLGPNTLPATPENVRKGLHYVDRLEANGGTMMERGIVAALSTPIEQGRRRIVTFMTDGYIGNERDILRAVHTHIGDARIFSFGVGSSTNRYLLERMAGIGRGIAAFIALNDSSEEQVDQLFQRLERPAFADLHIDWAGARVDGVEPQRLPDLFAGRPLLIHGRVTGALPDTIAVQGRVGTQVRSFTLEVGPARQHPALVKLWARARIRSLSDAMSWVATPDELVPEIRDLALTHGLASAYTSFVAVDSSRVTAGDHGTTVQVPAEMPRGVRYETTVDGSR